MVNPRSIIILVLAISCVVADKKCAKYTCATGADKSCVTAKADTSQNSITLTDICDHAKQYCKVDFPAYITLTTLDKDTNYGCADNAASKPQRYPGEECKVDDDCVKVQGDDKVGKCTDGKCTGHAETEACTIHSACLKGLYCDGLPAAGKCTKQKDKDATCASSYECQNQYLCKDKCSVVPYSLDTKTELPHDEMTGYMCKWEATALKDGKVYCTYQKQADAGDSNGVVKCDAGSKCKYDDDMAGSIEKDCACGYNADGQGYCPLGFNKHESEITDLLKLKAESFTQDCHTMSRAACYKLGDAKINTILTKQNTSANKHLYNGAVSCAGAVLSSNYMSVSMMLVALLVSLLF